MAVNWADNVEETTTSTGIGTIDLAGATAGNQTFVAGLGTGSACYYCISSNSEYEVGYGTVTDAATDILSRDSVLASSNGDALVSFSSGTKNVHLLPPFALRATRILDRDRDTRVDTDEGFADQDTIRFDAAGSEMATITANGLALPNGARIDEFSTDGTLAGNSDISVPTERAVKTYVDQLTFDEIKDADGNTRIQVEESVNENITWLSTKVRSPMPCSCSCLSPTRSQRRRRELHGADSDMAQRLETAMSHTLRLSSLAELHG